MKKHNSTIIKRVFDFLLIHEGIILLLAFQLLLRIPNLFEPYWYGDEGIYLTIGTALRYGSMLYAGIIDHKTPLIYYFAMVPSQFWFRMLLIGWTSVTTLLFYSITRSLRFSTKQRYFATFLFILTTTLPWLEGNIPNGELFVMGFVTLGAWFFAKTEFFRLFIENKMIPIKSVLKWQEVLPVVCAGISFGLAILTKVPALFDVLPFFSLGVFSLFDHFSVKTSRRVLFSMLALWQTLGMAVMTPILLSILYFAARGTLNSYIAFGLLYNFKYAGTWALPSLPLGLSFFLTMKGKLLVTASALLIFLGLKNKITSRSQFVASWAMLSLFGALLSSRPYPHYLLQLVPPFCLLIAIFSQKIWTMINKKNKQTVRKNVFELVATGIPIILLVLSIVTIKFGFYQTGKYYANFFQYLTGSIDKREYYNRFNWLMSDNYQAAAILQTSKQKRIFIWGTDPMLYALSQKIPVGRFTVSFHIADFPGAFEETYKDLTTVDPEFVVVMKDETIKFPEFFTYLNMNYIPFKELDHMIIYKKTRVFEKALELPPSVLQNEPPSESQ